MKVVKGKNYVLLIDGEPIACLRSVSMATSTEFIETTTVGDGNGATYKPKKNTTTASMEGVVFVNETGKHSIKGLRQSQLNHELFEDATLVRTNEEADTYTDTFDFYIANINDTGASGDFGTFQMDIQINGNPVIS